MTVRRILVAEIIELVAAEYKIPAPLFRERTRRRSIAHPRQVVMLLARRAGYSTPQIAKALGLLDHTSVLHGSQAAGDRALGDPDEAERLNRLAAQLWPAGTMP